MYMKSELWIRQEWHAAMDDGGETRCGSVKVGHTNLWLIAASSTLERPPERLQWQVSAWTWFQMR